MRETNTLIHRIPEEIRSVLSLQTEGTGLRTKSVAVARNELLMAERKSMPNKRRHEKPADVLIIGGGVIGCAIAYALRKHHITVTLLEKGEKPGRVGQPLLFNRCDERSKNGGASLCQCEQLKRDAFAP